MACANPKVWRPKLRVERPPILALPAEQRADNESLARLQFERLPLELAFGKLQHLLEEGEGVPRRIVVEPDAILALQIRDVPFAGIAYMRSGYNLA